MEEEWEERRDPSVQKTAVGLALVLATVTGAIVAIEVSPHITLAAAKTKLKDVLRRRGMLPSSPQFETARGGILDLDDDKKVMNEYVQDGETVFVTSPNSESAADIQNLPNVAKLVETYGSLGNAAKQGAGGIQFIGTS